jgi:presequence protease
MKHQTTKFGLGLLFSLTPLMNHNGDVIEAVNLTQQIDQLKENIKSNPKYLQQKVQQYFKDNTHKLILTMSPDDTYEQKFVARETQNLQEKVSILKPADKEKIFEDGKLLSQAQKSREDVNCLPCLKITDVSTPPKHELNFEKIHKIPLQICETNTNGVVYFRGILDASTLSENNKKLLPLFTQIIDQFGTKNHDFRDFDNRGNSKTAGLRFSTHLAENINDNNSYEIGLQFGSYALKENAPEMFQIIADLLTTVEFNDLARFEMLLENYMSALSVGIADSGHVYAMQNANGLVSEAGRLKESMMGIEHLSYMKHLLKTKSSAEILEEIKEISKKLLSRSPVRCSLNVSGDDAEMRVKNVEDFLKQLPLDKAELHWNKSKFLESQCRHNVMNIPVNYCAKSIVTVPYTNKDFSSLRVLGKILSSKYLLPVVREQNGAYGAGAKISIDGLFNFFSYRDPNTRRTLETFDASSAWVKESFGKVVDEQALFEAKLGLLQQLDTPISPMDIGLESFKHGISHEIFTKQRENILATSLKDIENVTEKYLSDDSKMVTGKSVIGQANEELSKQKGEKWIVNEQKE